VVFTQPELECPEVRSNKHDHAWLLFRKGLATALVIDDQELEQTPIDTIQIVPIVIKPLRGYL